MSVQVEGVGVALRDLAALRDDLDALPDAWQAIGERAATSTAALAPHRSGRLSRSVGFLAYRGRAVVVAGSASVPYAGPINYGWPARHIRASLFLEHGADQIEHEAAELIEHEANQAIERKGF